MHNACFAAELRLGLGVQVNRKRVERLMRQADIQGIYRRRGRKNLVNTATSANQARSAAEPSRDHPR